MGRSRGGLTTKVHALVDACGLPIALKLSEGQAHDGPAAVSLFDTVKPGCILLADCAYDSDALRSDLAGRGACGNIRPMSRRKSRPAFSAWLYRQRNAVVVAFAGRLQYRRSVGRGVTDSGVQSACSHPDEPVPVRGVEAHTCIVPVDGHIPVTGCTRAHFTLCPAGCGFRT